MKRDGMSDVTDTRGEWWMLKASVIALAMLAMGFAAVLYAEANKPAAPAAPARDPNALFPWCYRPVATDGDAR
jgi:hypothetical protein